MSRHPPVTYAALLAPVFIVGAALVANRTSNDLVFGLNPKFLAGFLVGFGIVMVVYLVFALRSK